MHPPPPQSYPAPTNPSSPVPGLDEVPEVEKIEDTDNTVETVKVPKSSKPSASVRRAPSPPPGIVKDQFKPTPWLGLRDPDPQEAPAKPKRTVCPGMKVLSNKSKKKQQLTMNSWVRKSVPPPSSQSTAEAPAATTTASRPPLATSRVTSGVGKMGPEEDSNSGMYQTSKDMKCVKVRAEGMAINLKDAPNAWCPETKMTSPGGSQHDLQ